MLKMNQLAELKTLYPEFDLHYEDLLKGTDRATLIKFATFLIGKNLFSGEVIDSKDTIEKWFSLENRIFADEMLYRLNAYKKKTGKDLTIVYNISCLKVLQYGLELEAQGLLNTKSNAQSEIDLMFAMLALNQNEDYNQTKDTAKINAMFGKELRPAAIMLNFSFPTQDITNFEFAEYTVCQVIKFLMLFLFLEQNDIGQELIKRFCNYYGIKNWRDYIAAVFPLIIAWTEREQAGAVDIFIEPNGDYDKNIDFLKKLALTDYVKVEDIDYIKLRERPLIQLDPNNFRVIHPLFIADKIYKGQFFLLKQLNDIEPKLVPNFRSWYTTNFSEGFCFNELIKYAFPFYSAMFFDDELKAKGIIGPPDCYLRFDNAVALLENKDIFIGAGIKGSYDFEALNAEIKKKLLQEGKKPVGIGQVITNIRKLLTGENKFDDGLDINAASIYPVIVLHDPMFDAPGLNKFMNAMYQEELAKLKSCGLSVDLIKPLTLINIDTLIQLAPVLKSGKVTLTEILDAFFKQLNMEGRTWQESAEQQEKFIKDSLLPFSYFAPVYLHSKLGNGWRSQKLMDELFKRSKIE
jgi:hypothetical protein